MNDRTMRTAGSVAVTLGLAVLCFILLLTALHGVGTDAGLYYAEQTKAGVLPAAGISDADLQTLDAFLAAGVNMQDRVFFSDNSIDAGYELGWEMVRKNKLSKVILCVYDMVALGIMSALNEAGIHIGEDVKILATSTSPQYLFSRSYPPMTVVDLHSQEVAMKSMTLALHLATRQITGEQHLIVQPSIIYRQSCPLIPHLG